MREIPTILILEDEKDLQRLIIKDLPKDIKAVMVATKEAFREEMERFFSNPDEKPYMYFLDDRVLDNENTGRPRRGIGNTLRTLLNIDSETPPSRIFCTSSSRHADNTCKKFNIERINKADIGKKIRECLSLEQKEQKT